MIVLDLDVDVFARHAGKFRTQHVGVILLDDVDGGREARGGTIAHGEASIKVVEELLDPVGGGGTSGVSGGISHDESPGRWLKNVPVSGGHTYPMQPPCQSLQGPFSASWKGQIPFKPPSPHPHALLPRFVLIGTEKRLCKLEPALQHPFFLATCRRRERHRMLRLRHLYSAW